MTVGVKEIRAREHDVEGHVAGGGIPGGEAGLGQGGGRQHEGEQGDAGGEDHRQAEPQEEPTKAAGSTPARRQAGASSPPRVTRAGGPRQGILLVLGEPGTWLADHFLHQD